MDSDILPPFMLIIFQHLNEEEKEYFRQLEWNKKLDNLEDLKELLLHVLENTVDHSHMFFFALGKIFYNLGEMGILKETYRQNKSPGMGLWCGNWLLNEGEMEEFEELTLKLEQELENSILIVFLYYIEARYFLLTQQHEKFKDRREKCYNYQLYTKDNNFLLSEFYKFVISYMFILDSHYMRSTDVLILARDKIKQAIDMTKTIKAECLHAMCYNSISRIELDRGNFQLAHQFLLKAEAISKKLKYFRLLWIISSEIGVVYSNMGHFSEAMFWFDKSQKIMNRWQNDNRGLYMLHFNRAEVYFAKEAINQAIEEIELAISIAESKNFAVPELNLKYIEILLHDNQTKKAGKLLEEFENKKKGIITQSEKVLIWFLKGFYEVRKSNYGHAQELLQQAMLLADYLGNEVYCSKTLVLLLIVFLQKYNITLNLEELIDADKCLEDIITYLEETAKYESVSHIYFIRAKIKMALLDFETALFLLKKGEEYARVYTPQLAKEYAKKILYVKQAIKKELEDEEELETVDFQEDPKIILTILGKESKKLAAPRAEKPIAVLIFHSSGIPIRTYTSDEVTVSDDLLFGGFVSAIRHLMDELFIDQKHGVLSIDHGQYKLLIEFSDSDFSIAVIALRDSFMLRRKMHRLVEHLALKDIFSRKYRGDLNETIAYELDTFIFNLFSVKGHKT